MWPFLFLCAPLPSLLRFIRFDVYVPRTDLPYLNLMFMSSFPCCPATPFPPAESFAARVTFLCPPLPLFAQIYKIWWFVQIYHIWWLCYTAQGRNFYYGANFLHKCGAVALKLSGAVFRHIVSLLVFFVSHGFASVSHPKFLFRFEAKQAKLGGQFCYFASKSFASFRFSFALKQLFGDTLYVHTGDRVGRGGWPYLIWFS